MKILSKLAVIMTFVALMFGTFPTANAIDILPSPIPISPTPIPTHDLRGYSDFNLLPQPGFNVTLLLNQKVHFNLNDTQITGLVIVDDKGKKIFETASAADKGSVDIVPADIKLESGKKYSWTVNGSNDVYKFTILDKKFEKDFLGAVDKI